MNARDTKRLACRITEQLMRSYLDSGNVMDWPECDPDKLTAAFEDLQDEMWRRGGKVNWDHVAVEKNQV